MDESKGVYSITGTRVVATLLIIVATLGFILNFVLVMISSMGFFVVPPIGTVTSALSFFALMLAGHALYLRRESALIYYQVGVLLWVFMLVSDLYHSLSPDPLREVIFSKVIFVGPIWVVGYLYLYKAKVYLRQTSTDVDTRMARKVSVILIVVAIIFSLVPFESFYKAAYKVRQEKVEKSLSEMNDLGKIEVVSPPADWQDYSYTTDYIRNTGRDYPKGMINTSYEDYVYANEVVTAKDVVTAKLPPKWNPAPGIDYTGRQVEVLKGSWPSVTLSAETSGSLHGDMDEYFNGLVMRDSGKVVETGHFNIDDVPAVYKKIRRAYCSGIIRCRVFEKVFVYTTEFKNGIILVLTMNTDGRNSKLRDQDIEELLQIAGSAKLNGLVSTESNVEGDF